MYVCQHGEYDSKMTYFLYVSRIRLHSQFDMHAGKMQ